MSDFLQSRRERFINAILSNGQTPHQNSFRLDPSVVTDLRTQSASSIPEEVEYDAPGQDQTNAYLNAIFHNPLDDFLLPKYNIQLSIVNMNNSDGQAQGGAVENAVAPDTPQQLRRDTAPAEGTNTDTPISNIPLTYAQLNSMPFTIIAFNGQIDTDSNGSAASDELMPTLLGISQFNFKSYNSPSEQNPHVATFAEANMTVLEPYTFSFDRILNDVASELGYANIPSSRIIFRIDISFSGWAEDGRYHEKIDIGNPFSTTSGNQQVNKFTIFTNLIRVNAKINLSNSEITLHFVPVAFLSVGAAAEYLTVPAATIDIGEDRTFQAIMDTLITNLNNNVASQWQIVPVDDEGRQMSDPIIIPKYHYEYKCHPDMMAEVVFPDRAPDDDIVQQIYNGENIVAVIGNLVRATNLARTGLSDGTYPKVLWTVRVLTSLGEEDDRARVYLGDLAQIKITFIIEPFYDFRYVPNTRAQALDSKGERIAALLANMALRRVYWYDHYGLNTEVIRFDQDLNNFYFKNVIDIDFNTSFGPARSNTPNDEMNQPSRTDSFAQINPSGGLSGDQTSQVASALNIRPRTSIANLRRSRSGAAGATPASPRNGPDGTTASSDQVLRLYENEFNNLVQTDLITLENMEVRGDPRWLFNGATRTWNGMDETNYMPMGESRSDVILVNVMSPKASQYMSTDYSTALATTENTNYDFSGFYQIVSVEHQFNGGLYTQKFMGTRIVIDPIDAAVSDAEREDIEEVNSEAISQADQQRREREAQERRETRERQRLGARGGLSGRLPFGA